MHARGFLVSLACGGDPWLQSASGVRPKLEVDNFVPYLREEEYVDESAAPAPSAPSADVAPEAGPEVPEPVVLVGLPSVPVSEGDPPAPEAPLLPGEGRDLKAEAASIAHLMTHMPNNPHCPACQRAKIQMKPARSLHRLDDHTVRFFGEQVTAEHVI